VLRYRDFPFPLNVLLNILTRELAVTAAQLDGLLESGAAYRDLYRTGAYGYRLLRFRGPREIAAIAT
jgi:hypothetical protein